MNTTYRQDIWNYGTGKLRNCGEGFGGRTAVVALKNGFSHFLRFAVVLLLMVVGVSGVKAQLPFTPTTDTNGNEVIDNEEKIYYMIQSYVNTAYYMRPNVTSSEVRVNTLNIITDDMKWYFLPSGESDYYYICDKNDRYMYFSRAEGSMSSRTWMQLMAFDNNNADNFKFTIAKNNSYNSYNIIPKGNTKSYCLNKQGGNAGAYSNDTKTGDVQITDGYNDEGSCWNFIAVTDFEWTLLPECFQVSTDESILYYKIKSKYFTDPYYIKPKTTYVGTSNSTNENDLNDMVWYFKEAGSNGYIKYYYIIHATTGDYLRYRSDSQGSSQATELKQYTGNEAEAEENRFKFLVVRGANPDEKVSDNKGITFNIVPKLLENAFTNDAYKYYCLSSTKTAGSDLNTANLRSDHQGHWNFEPVWGDPVVTCDENGTITITGEDGSTFYYTTDGSTVPTTEETQYNATNKPTVSAGITTIKVRAIGGDKSPSRVITQMIVYVPNQTFESSTYDGTVHVPVVTVGETTISSEEYDISYTKDGTDVTECKDAATYTVEITDKDGGDYIVYGSGSFTINKKALAATVDDKSVTYGDAVPTYTATYSGLVNGEETPGFTTQPTFACDYTTTSDVSESPYTITVTGGSAPNYEITTYTTGTLTVNPKEVVLTWGETTSFTYDGQAHTLSATVGGLVNDDEIGVTLTQSEKEGSSLIEGNAINAGSYTVTASVLTGAKAGNYSLPTANTQDFTISKAPLTVTAKPMTITYGDAPTNDGVTYGEDDGNGGITNGFVNNETTDVLSGTLAYAYTYTQFGNVGSYTITPSGLEATNYEITYVPGTLTVGQKEVGLTWSSTSLIYNGTAQAPVAAATGLVNDDEISVSVTGTQTNVGTDYTATASELTGQQATNYKLPSTNNTTTFEITAKAVTITANNASRTYNSTALTESGFTASALEDGDTHTFTVFMTEGSTITNVGTLPNVIATVDGTAVTTGIETAVGNYLVTTANGTLEVTAKAVTITAKDASRAYNGSALTENGFEKTALEEGDEHEFVVVMTEASTITNVGTTGNVIATVDGIAVITGTETTVGNYLVTTADGTLTVNAKAVTITANDASKPYDGSALTEAGFTASALETGDTHTFTVVMTDESTITNAGTQPNVIATVDGISVTTGEETVVGNYLVTTVNGTLTVTGKLITITADSDTKVYDGTALTKDSYTCDNAELDEGDVITSVTVTGSQTVVGSSDNVPSEAVIMNGETDVTGKYFITYVNGTLEVTPKVVTITASDASKTYDGAALTAGFTTTALETGDTHEFIVVMTEGSTITNVGTTGNVIATVDGIAVTTGIEAAVGNYLVTTANGTLTVEQKAVTITANDASKPYDGSALTEGGFTTSALEEGDTHVFTVVMTEGSTITDAGTQPNVIATVDGVSVTTGVQTEVGNYLVTTVAGTLAIGGKPIGDGSLAAGFTISFDQDNNVILMDGGTTLDEGTDYTIDDDATTSASGRYSIRTIRGTGNYGGTASIRNAIVSFTNDGKGGSEYSATFVAENANPDAEPDPEKGHELPDGITAYIISAINGNTVNAVALSYIPEGVPVLLLSNAALNGFQVHDVSDQTPPTGNNLLKEVTEESRHFDVKTIYLLYKNEFAYNKAGDLAKGKVYLDPASSSPSGARLVINWGAENGVDTSLLSPLASPLSEVWHSLDGRRLSGKPTKKGLYIRDGEIVVIK